MPVQKFQQFAVLRCAACAANACDGNFRRRRAMNRDAGPAATIVFRRSFVSTGTVNRYQSWSVRLSVNAMASNMED
jgi:hypothetical protein